MKKIILAALLISTQLAKSQVTTLTLTADTLITNSIIANNNTKLIINLNGYSIKTATNINPFIAMDNSAILIKNGKIRNSKNWGACIGDNSCLQWYNTNIGRGEMTKNFRQLAAIYFIDGILK